MVPLYPRHGLPKGSVIAPAGRATVRLPSLVTPERLSWIVSASLTLPPVGVPRPPGKSEGARVGGSNGSLQVNVTLGTGGGGEGGAGGRNGVSGGGPGQGRGGDGHGIQPLRGRRAAGVVERHGGGTGRVADGRGRDGVDGEVAGLHGGRQQRGGHVDRERG